jgi:hypothetical protein
MSSSPSSLLKSVGEAFRPTDRGVVGLVDDLLRLCSEQGLELDWHADHCRVRSVGVEPEASIDVPLPQSAFRAALARLAALCTDRNHGSVSPYGGEGELMVGDDSSTVYRVAFTNTLSTQRVRLTPVQQENHTGERQTHHFENPRPSSETPGINSVAAPGEART